VTNADEGTRRRRRRRGRGGGAGQSSAHAGPKGPPRPELPDWKWLSFPVFFAFSLGIVVDGFVSGDPLMRFIFFAGGLCATAFGVAHIVTRHWIANRRRPR
jgi:hypothetical protein